MLVERQPRTRTGSVITAGESVNHALRPGSADMRQLVGHTAPAFTRASAAGHCGSVEVPFAIESDAFIRLAAVRAASETVEHGVFPTVA